MRYFIAKTDIDESKLTKDELDNRDIFNIELASLLLLEATREYISRNRNDQNNLDDFYTLVNESLIEFITDGF